ncbi:MAG: hypothetical protein JSR84_00920 [Proteobacteria bacterium]|nr:hypothetical protein [Pseudomonadota bacterium]
MGDHDAASIVGRMAGLDSSAGANPPQKVTPDQLIEAFCGDRAAGLVADPGESESDGIRTARGHCGYMGGRGDGLAVGFDDGYDFMGYLEERGWRALAAKGDWPYVVYMLTEHGAGYAIAEYCERDLVVTVLPTEEQTRVFYSGLREAP